MQLHLRNPHSILAALATRAHDVREIRLNTNRPQGAWTQVAEQAAANRVSVVYGSAPQNSRRRPKSVESKPGGRTGAAMAIVNPRQPVDLKDLFDKSSANGDSHGLWLALDCIQDPQNVGAIFRTAAFFGVAGIVVTKDRSAPLNATVYDVASGGLELVPFSAPTNLGRALEAAKSAGLWVLGASEHAEEDIADVGPDRDWLLVVGNEESGIRRKTLSQCDVVRRLTPRGELSSLNVSVAAGILMSHIARIG